jgi:PAS domain S-box-containing protein
VRIRSLLTTAVVFSILVVVAMLVSVWLVSVQLEESRQIHNLARQVSRQVSAQLVLTLEFALNAEPRSANQWRVRQGIIIAGLSQQHPFDTRVPQEALVTARTLNGLFEKLVIARSAPRSDLQQRRIQVILDHLLSHSQALADMVLRWSSMANTEWKRRDQAFRAFVIVFSMLVLFILLTLAWILVKRVLRPLQQFHQSVRAVAKGDFSVRTQIPLKDEFGDLTRSFDAMALDMVAHLRAEVRERQESERALRNSKERLEVAASAGIVGIWEWDIEQNRLLWDQVMCQLYGMPQASRSWTYAEWLDTIHHDDRAGSDARMQAALSGEQEYRDEFRIRWPDGSLHYIKAAARVSHDAEGRPLKMVGIDYDLTEQKEVQLAQDRMNSLLEQRVAQRTHELERARDAAEAANLAKSTFLSNMSHELRTPLNAILGFAQLMERDQRIPEDERSNIATINRSGKHLLSLINDVLEISRIESGQLSLNLEVVDLQEQLDNLAEVMGVRARQKGLSLVLEQAADLPAFIRVDATKLRQVLINLVSNAIKYTAQGEVRIGVFGQPEDERFLLVFDVSDTGEGIAAADLERIFHAFYQTEQGAALGDGTGLGLAIGRKYAEWLGGALQVDSVPGEGSVFHFSLPVEPVSCFAGALPPKGEVIGIAPDQPVYRILVAEDHVDNRQLVTQMLEQVGFCVKGVSNGDQAVAQALAWRPHFIWMDMRMPVMDGYEATRRIRQAAQAADIKIAALTASAFQEDREAILAVGCDAFVRKPIDHATFFQVMHDLLGVRYIHAEPKPAEDRSDEAVDLQALAALPEGLKASLRLAAEQLDSGKMRGLIQATAEHSVPLSEALQSLVAEFRFDKIIALLQRL